MVQTRMLVCFRPPVSSFTHARSYRHCHFPAEFYAEASFPLNGMSITVKCTIVSGIEVVYMCASAIWIYSDYLFCFLWRALRILILFPRVRWGCGGACWGGAETVNPLKCGGWAICGRFEGGYGDGYIPM